MRSFCIKPAKNYKKKNKDFAFFSESVYSAEIQPIFPLPKIYCGVGFPPFFRCSDGSVTFAISMEFGKRSGPSQFPPSRIR
jgi:hypothetical protein